MKTKKNHEGYLMIDHRITLELGGQVPRIGTFFEGATKSCGHCRVPVVLNPDRTRPRGYCPNCDSYVCDSCEAVRVQTGACHPFAKIEDETIEGALRAQNLAQV